MGFGNRAVAAAGVGFAVAALVGCGGSGSLLNSSQEQHLDNQLSAAESALGTDNCKAASQQLQQFESYLDSLSSVNQTVVSNLQQGISTTEQLAARECPVSTSTSTTPTTTTSTQTTSTSTTPTTTTSTTPTTTTSTTPTTTTTSTTPTTTTSTTPTTTTPASGGTGLPSSAEVGNSGDSSDPASPGNGYGHGRGGF